MLFLLHSCCQVAKIETEKMLIQMVEAELEKRAAAGTYKGRFNGQSHFFGYISQERDKKEWERRREISGE